jgi:hypothetical protein
MASKKAPQTPPQPVRLTDSEDVFCKAIGLDINEHNDRLLLSEIKVGICTERCVYMSATFANTVGCQAVCLQSWRRLSTNRLALLPSLQHDVSVLPNFTTAQISFAALQEECEGILAAATGHSRAILALGQSTADGSKVNWVIYWLLWQAKDLLTLERRMDSRRSQSLTGDASRQASGTKPRDDREKVFWDPARNL